MANCTSRAGGTIDNKRERGRTSVSATACRGTAGGRGREISKDWLRALGFAFGIERVIK